MNNFEPLDIENNNIGELDDNVAPLEFLLEIQEISGRNVAQKYVDYLIDEFEKRRVKYEFELVPNDDEVELNKYIGGGDLTFPYNYFHSFANKIKKILNNKQTTEESKNYILNLFENKTKEIDEEDDEEHIISSVTVNEDKKKSSLVLPKHYTGLIKIHLLIYDNSRESSVGRIYDLNNWINNRE